MRLVISFFLSLVIYVSILFFLISILQFKKPPKKEVLIHTAIVPSIKKVSIKKQSVKKQIQKSLKKSSKLKSKSIVTKGGEDIKFSDIFKEVKYNVKTPKIKQKANLDMSRLKGIEKSLNKIKNLKMNISIKSNNANKVNIDEITKKLGKVWDSVSVNNGDYAIIRIVSTNGVVKAFVLDTNLETDIENELISQLENLTFDKNFDITVKFQTKGD